MWEYPHTGCNIFLQHIALSKFRSLGLRSDKPKRIWSGYNQTLPWTRHVWCEVCCLRCSKLHPWFDRKTSEKCPGILPSSHGRFPVRRPDSQSHKLLLLLSQFLVHVLTPRSSYPASVPRQRQTSWETGYLCRKCETDPPSKNESERGHFLWAYMLKILYSKWPSNILMPELGLARLDDEDSGSSWREEHGSFGLFLRTIEYNYDISYLWLAKDWKPR